MISTIDIQFASKNPSIPLETFKSFVGSPSSIRLRNIPKKIGNWEITQVFVSVKYPDNTMHIDEATNVNGIWVSTLPASLRSGKFNDGFNVIANGVDEEGNFIQNYILGKGDVEIYNADAEIGNGTSYYLHLYDEVQDVSEKGDSILSGNALSIYDGNEWKMVGGQKVQKQADWNQTLSTQVDFIKNKPVLKAVATSGSYNDLTDKPTIPQPISEYLKTATVANNTLTLTKQDGTDVTFQGGGSGPSQYVKDVYVNDYTGALMKKNQNDEPEPISFSTNVFGETIMGDVSMSELWQGKASSITTMIAMHFYGDLTGADSDFFIDVDNHTYRYGQLTGLEEQYFYKIERVKTDTGTYYLVQKLASPMPS